MTRLRMDELVNAWVADRCTPFQIALLGVFDATPFLLADGALDVPRIRRELVVRARRVPGLGRRVVWTRAGEGRPVWARDPAFDPERHIESANLPPGSELADWAANRILVPLPLDRPLWRAEIIGGLPGQRFAVIIVVHHVAADGRAGVALAGSLLDRAADAAPQSAPLPTAPPLPSHRELLLDHLRQVLTAVRRIRPPTAETRRRVGLMARQFRAASADLRTRTSDTSLPRQVGPARRLAVLRQPLDELRGTGHALDATLNDLLLVAVTGGLRQLLSARGEPVERLRIRTSVPTFTGATGQTGGVMLVDLPVAEPDPLRCLRLINRTTTRAKRRLHEGAPVLTDVLRLPVPLARLGMRWMRRFGGTRVSLFVTDVAGPSVPLWLAGARLLEAVPVAPLVQNVGLGITALSYAGELVISVQADGSVTDLDLLADGMATSFTRLREAAADGARLQPVGTGT
jgi:diacylglycerol O-acyltransferase